MAASGLADLTGALYVKLTTGVNGDLLQEFYGLVRARAPARMFVVVFGGGARSVLAAGNRLVNEAADDQRPGY